MWMPQKLINEKSTPVQVVACCRLAWGNVDPTSSYGVTRSRLVKIYQVVLSLERMASFVYEINVFHIRVSDMEDLDISEN